MPTSTSTRSSEPRPRTRGFTLLELAIVLLVLAVAVSFVIPRLRDPDALALSSSAARLAATVRYVAEEATFRQIPMRLNLDLDGSGYWISVPDDAPQEPQHPDAPAFVPDERPLSAPIRLPDGVVFADVVLPALGTVREGVVFAEFLPEGWADPLVVHLRGRGGRETTLAFEPLTGRARVAEGYFALELGADHLALGPRREGTRARRDARR